MAKLISCAVLVLLAMTGLRSPASAQVPGGGGEVVCQFVQGGLVTDQTGGTFPVGPAHCNRGGEAEADIAIQPVALLSASVSTAGLEAADRTGFTALAALQYDFTLTGGNVGDLVPVLVLTGLHTSADPSDDPNNANTASANIDVRSLSPVSGVVNEDSTFACSVSPVDCDQLDDVEAELEITMASGSAGRVFMQVLVAASSTSGGGASAQIDPFIFVDPRFANAADYTITVASGVANARPVAAVPEPGDWALLLAGLGGLGAAGRRRRTWAAS